MKAKIFLLLFAMVFLIGLASADLNTGKVGQCKDIITTVNSSAVNITAITSPSPNSTTYFINQPMTKNGYNSFNYSFCNTSVPGVYDYGYYDAEGNVYSNSFSITASGEQINPYKAIGYIVLILVVIALAIAVGKAKEKILAQNLEQKLEKIYGEKNQIKFFLYSLMYGFLTQAYVPYYFLGLFGMIIIRSMIGYYYISDLFSLMNILLGVYAFFVIGVGLIFFGYLQEMIHDIKKAFEAQEFE